MKITGYNADFKPTGDINATVNADTVNTLIHTLLRYDSIPKIHTQHLIEEVDY